PPTLHVDEPTPHVDWNAGGVRLLTESRAWPSVGRRPRRAGVSSFGISGTNAHVIVEQAPQASYAESPAGGAVGAVGWVLSARTVAALRAYAGRIAAAVSSGMSVADIAATLAARSVFEHRAVVVGATREQLLAGLTSIENGVLADNAVMGTAGAG